MKIVIKRKILRTFIFASNSTVMQQRYIAQLMRTEEKIGATTDKNLSNF